MKLIEFLIHIAIILLLVLWTARPLSAQETVTQGALREATEAAAKKSEYVLPYPGILPDHPLYILKVIRDRVIDFLIADTLKEAEFTLLQADKRLSAAVFLVAKGKNSLAESTVSKSQNYLSRTISLLDKAKKEGKDTNPLTTKLISALEKHEEVLLELAGKTDGFVKERFESMAANVSKERKNLQK